MTLSAIEGAHWWTAWAHRRCVVRSGDSHRVDGALLAGLLGGSLTLDDLDLAATACAAAESDAEAWREADRRGLLR